MRRWHRTGDRLSTAESGPSATCATCTGNPWVRVVDGITFRCPTRNGEVGMRVQRVLMPGTAFESWTVLGDDLMPVERFLSYLASIEKSPNTIKAYAHDLKDWLTYLDRHGVDWRAARLEDVAGFVAWLRLPPQARDGLVSVQQRSHRRGCIHPAEERLHSPRPDQIDVVD